MPFSVRPHRRLPMQCPVTYNAGGGVVEMSTHTRMMYLTMLGVAAVLLPAASTSALDCSRRTSLFWH